MRFKEFKHLPVVALVAVGLALAGCGGGGGPSQAELDAANDGAAEQAEEVKRLQGLINAALEELGEEADADLGNSIEALQARLKELTKQISDANEEKGRMAVSG